MTFGILILSLVIFRPVPSHSQTGTPKTPEQLNAEVAGQLQTGSQIRASQLRQVLLDMIASDLNLPSTVAGPNQFWAGPPSGSSSASPVFRALVPADIPPSIINATTPLVSVKTFGAVCDGATDDTVAVQAAITVQSAAGAALFFPSGVCMISSVSVPAPGLTLAGTGPESIVRQLANTDANMFNALSDSTNLTVMSMAIDGNWQNQTNDANHEYASINFRSDSAAGSPSSLTVRDSLFVNGRSYDVFAQVADSSNPVHINIQNNKFLGGIEGTFTYYSTYVHLAGAIQANISNNMIDFNAFGAVPVSHGRAGLQLTVLVSSPEAANANREVVIGNTLRYVGRSTDNVARGVIGAIDFYTGGTNIVISGNRLEQPAGRGINVKSNESLATITGNSIDGLVTLNGPTSVGAQISGDPGVNSTVGHGLLITGNVVRNSSNHGLQAIGIHTGSTDSEHAVSIVGNTVQNAASRGIYVYSVNGAIVADNNVEGCDTGLYATNIMTPLQITGNTFTNTVHVAVQAQSDPAVTAGNVLISGNAIDNPGTYGIFAANINNANIVGNQVTNASNNAPISVGDTFGNVLVTGNSTTGGVAIQNRGNNTALWVDGNYADTAYTFTGLSSAVVSNSVTAWTNTVIIDDTAGNQTVNNIQGVPEGAKLVVQATSNTNTASLVPVQAATPGPIDRFGVITGGAAYNGGGTATFSAVPLTGGTGTGATATITVTAGVVTNVQIVGGVDSRGTGYLTTDTVSAAVADLGNNGGGGFSVPIAQIHGGLIMRGGMTLYTTADRITFQMSEGSLVELGRMSSVASSGTDVFASGQNNIAGGTATTAFGQTNNITGAAAFGTGFSNTTTSSLAVVFGQLNSVSGTAGFVSGQRATDRGRYNTQVFAAGNLGTTGDSQVSLGVLRVQSGTDETPVRLTADDAAAGSANCFNIPDNTIYGLNVDISALDHSSPTNNQAWFNWTMLLARVSGTTTLQQIALPTPLTNGTVTGSTMTATADDTNKCLNLTFTPPTGNTHRWNVVARVQTVEVQ